MPDKKPCDDICILANCKNLSVCLGPCAPLVWIDGNKPLKEKLLREDSDARKHEDYNAVLSHLIASKQVNHIDDIRALPDMRIRCIAACLYADIPVKNIACLMRLQRDTIYKIIKKAPG